MYGKNKIINPIPRNQLHLNTIDDELLEISDLEMRNYEVIS